MHRVLSVTQPGPSGVGLGLSEVHYLFSKFEVPTVCRPGAALMVQRQEDLTLEGGDCRRMTVVFKLLSLSCLSQVKHGAEGGPLSYLVLATQGGLKWEGKK